MCGIAGCGVVTFLGGVGIDNGPFFLDGEHIIHVPLFVPFVLVELVLSLLVGQEQLLQFHHVSFFFHRIQVFFFFLFLIIFIVIAILVCLPLCRFRFYFVNLALQNPNPFVRPGHFLRQDGLLLVFIFFPFHPTAMSHAEPRLFINVRMNVVFIIR